MSLILNGTDGLSDVDGTAATPAIRGTDTNTGIFFPAADTIAFSEGGTEVARFDSNGDLGIGTTNPTQQIHVKGTDNKILIESTDYAALTLQSGSTRTFNLQSINDSSGAFRIFDVTAVAERMRIDSSGNLLVGASSLLGQTSKSLVVNSSNSAVGLIVQSSASGDVGIDGIRIGKFDNNATTSQIFVRFTINNQAIGSGSITANGANACTFGSFSDERLKENIVNLPSQLENICSLRPVEFDYKAGGHQIGFIAQEMQEVYPDSVSAGSDEMLMIGGWSKTEARLVKAIQELKAIVDAQAARIAALEEAAV
jgi:hypothetical protein